MSSQQRNAPMVLPETLAECEAVMNRLSADCNSVRDQLADARAKRISTGRYADADWFRRAESALRWMNRDRQRLQEHMAALRRKEGGNAGARRDAMLIALLRQHVSPEVFKTCADQVREAMEAGHA